MTPTTDVFDVFGNTVKIRKHYGVARKRNYIDQTIFDRFYNDLENLIVKIQAFKNSLK
jgi:hypothetical protein